MTKDNDDDQPYWFSDGDSSDSAHRAQEPYLEAVPQSEPESHDPGWFAYELSDPPPESSSGPSSRARGAKLVFTGTVAAVLIVLGVGAFALANLLGGDESAEPEPLTVPTTESSPQPSDEASVTEAAASSGAPSDHCESSESPTVTTGDGKGDTESVPGVILAFQHHYYVSRDAEKIGQLLSKDTEITDLDALQKGIDSVPEGTTHCLRVVSDGDRGEATVELTETPPDDTETVYKQHVSTTREAGEVRIVTIEDRS